jgi:hypothetical protein
LFIRLEGQMGTPSLLAILGVIGVGIEIAAAVHQMGTRNFIQLAVVGQFEFLRASERPSAGGAPLVAKVFPRGTLRSSLDYLFPFDVGVNAPDNISADQADG